MVLFETDKQLIRKKVSQLSFAKFLCFETRDDIN